MAERKPEPKVVVNAKKAGQRTSRYKRRYAKHLKPGQNIRRMAATESKVEGLRRLDDPISDVLYSDFPEIDPQPRPIYNVVKRPVEQPKLPKPQNTGPLWALYETLLPEQQTPEFLHLLMEEIRRLNPGKYARSEVVFDKRADNRPDPENRWMQAPVELELFDKGKPRQNGLLANRALERAESLPEEKLPKRKPFQSRVNWVADKLETLKKDKKADRFSDE